MSSGKVHNRVTLVSGFVTGVYTALQVDIKIGLALFGGHLLGLLLSPDWDIDVGTNANKHARQLGIGLLFNVVIKPYSLAYKHRSNASHLPVFSTVWRLFYLLIPFIVLLNKNQPTSRFKLFMYAIPAQLLVLPLWLPIFWLYQQPYQNLIVAGYFILGLMLSDLLHWTWDQF